MKDIHPCNEKEKSDESFDIFFCKTNVKTKTYIRKASIQRFPDWG